MSFTKVFPAAVAAALVVGGIGLAQADQQRGGGRMIERAIGFADQNQDGTVTEDELNTARAEAFESIDTDGDGILSDAEINAVRDAAREAMRNMLALAPVVGPQFIMGTFQDQPNADLNGDGEIDEEEFVAARGRAFDRIDANNDGTITSEEIEAVRERRGIRH